MKISITQFDIDKAAHALKEDFIPRCEACPIAQALKRLGYTDVKVYNRDVHFQGKSRFLTPEAADFVFQTDVKSTLWGGTIGIEPCEFELCQD